MDAGKKQLQDWFSDIRQGKLVLPRFQRYEAWSLQNVVGLLNTVLRGLPVGSLLVYRSREADAFVCRPLAGVEHEPSPGADYLLDGQQRLTGLWRALHNNYDNQVFFVRFEQAEESELPYYVDSKTRYFNKKANRWYPEWVKDPVALWKNKCVPLEVFCPGAEGERAFSSWQEACDPDRDTSNRVWAIRSSLSSYELPYLALSESVPKDVALDVFIKMNTTAVALSTYDIIVAQVEAQVDESLHDLVADIKESSPAIQSYARPEELILSVSAFLQDRAPGNAAFLRSDFAEGMMRNWDLLLKGIRRTVAFLEEERIYDAQRLPSEVVLPVLCALWAEAPEYGDAEGRARGALRKYMWRAFITDRYERATSSRSLVDYRQMKARLIGDDLVPEIFNEEQYPLPGVEELLDAAWPKRKDRLGRAVLAMSLRSGGLDLADGSTVSRENLGKREYHHLFPNARLQREGRSEREIFRSLNCALVTWKTNRHISDKEPERYLAERLDGTELGEEEIRQRLSTHLIPLEAMTAGDYDTFLMARAEMVHQSMLALCDGRST